MKCLEPISALLLLDCRAAHSTGKCIRWLHSVAKSPRSCSSTNDPAASPSAGRTTVLPRWSLSSKLFQSPICNCISKCLGHPEKQRIQINYQDNLLPRLLTWLIGVITSARDHYFLLVKWDFPNKPRQAGPNWGGEKVSLGTVGSLLSGLLTLQYNVLTCMSHGREPRDKVVGQRFSGVRTPESPDSFLSQVGRP